MKDTIKALRKYWPSFVDRDDFDFWSYQWLKHGTCSGLDPLPYFKLAISTTIEARQLLESLNRKGLFYGKSLQMCISLENTFKTFY